MKKFFVYASFLMIGWGIVLTGCKKEPAGADQGQNPPAAEEADFTFETVELTQGSFGVKISPEDENMTYYFGLMSKEDYEANFEDGEALQQYNLEYFKQYAASQGISLDQLLIESLMRGEQEYIYYELAPAADYIFYAYGLSTEGESLTSVNEYEFRAPAVEFMDTDFTITATDVTSSSFTVNVRPSDDECFYFYDVMPAATYEEYCGSNPANVPAFVEQYLAATYESYYQDEYSVPQFVAGVTVRGESSDSESYINLDAESAYYVFAVGVANDMTAYTDAAVIEVVTSETPKNEYEVIRSNASDVTFTATISAAQDENFAVMLERSVYFSDTDTDADIIRALYTANGEDISEYIHSRSANVEFTRLIPDEDYLLLIFACSPDGSPKLDESKVNLMKVPVHTAGALMSDADFSIYMYDVAKTSATVNVDASSGYDDETYLFNYMTADEYASIESQVDYFGGTVDEYLQEDMNEFIDASLEEWNNSHSAASQMDRKEFLSRSLLEGVGMFAEYELTDLEPGTGYVVYLFGMKADGTFTTSAVTEEFTTVADAASLATLSLEVAATDFFETSSTMYGIWGFPGGSKDKYYVKTFIDNDEWAGKPASELAQLLQKEGIGYKYSSQTPITVNWGSTWYAYAVCYDTNGTPTDVYKIVYAVPETGEGGLNYEYIDFDLIVVSDSASSEGASLSVNAEGLLSPSAGRSASAFEMKPVDAARLHELLLRQAMMNDSNQTH